MNKKLLILGSLILLLIGLPIMIFLSQKSQEIRSRASGSTTLSLTPSSTTSTPIKTRVGDKVSFDIMIDPGNNTPSVIKLDLAFDPAKLQANSPSFIVNSDLYGIIEGPITTTNNILVTTSANLSKSTPTPTKIGTVIFTAVAPTTDSPTLISFGNKSEILSLKADTDASENVLSTTTPAYIDISGGSINTSKPTLPSTTTSCSFASSINGTFGQMIIAGSQVWVISYGDGNNSKILRLNFDATEAAPPLSGYEIHMPLSLIDTGSEVWIAVFPGKILRFKHDGTSAGNPITIDGSISGLAMINSQIWLVEDSHRIYKYDLQGTKLNEAALPNAAIDPNFNHHILLGMLQVGSQLWIYSSEDNAANIIRYDLDLHQIGTEITVGNQLDSDMKIVGDQVWVGGSAISRFNFDGTVAGAPLNVERAIGILSFTNKVWISEGSRIMNVFNLDGANPQGCTPISNTSLTFNVFLHGIGNSGDSVNPSAHSFSNKNPIHTTRYVDVQIFDKSNNMVGVEKYTGLIYSSSSGSFKGALELEPSYPNGPYTIKIKEPTTLRGTFSKSIDIKIGQNNELPDITLSAGDMVDDNKLDILDYNLLMECYDKSIAVLKCTERKKLRTDLNDDGLVDQIDFNLFFREQLTKSGN